MRSLVWEPHELPSDCYFRELTALEGDDDLGNDDYLPVEANWDRIEAAIRREKVVGVKASTGSGKTVKLPYMLYEQSPYRPDGKSRYPVLVVVLSNVAAEKLV